MIKSVVFLLGVAVLVVVCSPFIVVYLVARGVFWVISKAVEGLVVSKKEED